MKLEEMVGPGKPEEEPEGEVITGLSGASKHMRGVQTCRGHPNIWKVSKHGASKHMGAV